MTDHTLDHNATTSVRKKHRQEGPRNHVLTFALSIMLTAFAFLAVAYSLVQGTHVESWFVYTFIVSLALFQAAMQLLFWMHMKDKGHAFPIYFIVMGFFVALTVVVSALFWIWW